jgi:photosystem II stability/assembly factor-like uncharacterized protein
MKHIGVAFLLFLISLCACVDVRGQRWLDTISLRKGNDLTLKDLRTAFYSYYRDRPVHTPGEVEAPKALMGEAEKQAEAEIEEYNLFKRWEWFMVPRVYPGGRWQQDKVEQIVARVRTVDNLLLNKLLTAGPLRTGVPGRIPAIPRWQPIGPDDAVSGTNMGRVNCIRFDLAHPGTLYIGAPNGGIWKTVDDGAHWTPIFDAEPSLSVGDIAIDPQNSAVLYAATSDAFGYGAPFWGGTYSVGIRKSIDGGSTWAPTGLNWSLAQNRTIRKLAIHPTNGNILLAATSDGLYRTTDAGTTWNQVWATSTYDVEFQQDNRNIVYATTDKIWKSVDAGTSFTGLTASCTGTRFNLRIARSNPDMLYALCTTGDLLKSTDGGTSWNTTTAPGALLYGYYDDVLAVSPVDENLVYVAGEDIKKSTDGGNTWTSISPAGHVDNHCIEFYPGREPAVLFGDDGGIFKSNDGGSTWASLNKGLAITQFYSAGLNRSGSFQFVAGAQDNGNMKYDGTTFSIVTGADGQIDFIDWSNTENIYVSTQNGVLFRSTDGGGTFDEINTPVAGAWTTPWCQDPKSPNTIYAGTNKVYKSLDQGTTWTPISTELPDSGTYTALAVSTANPSIIYAGCGSPDNTGSGGLLYKTTNGGTTWTNVGAGLPLSTDYLMRVAFNDKNSNIAYVTFSGYTNGQKVYKTIDGGNTWKNISGTLPNMPVNCIAYERSTVDALYIGTDAGVYYRDNSTNDWVPYKTGLPNVIVNDLSIQYGSGQLVAATYGRGIWKVPLKVPPAMPKAPLHR